MTNKQLLLKLEELTSEHAKTVGTLKKLRREYARLKKSDNQTSTQLFEVCRELAIEKANSKPEAEQNINLGTERDLLLQQNYELKHAIERLSDRIRDMEHRELRTVFGLARKS